MGRTPALTEDAASPPRRTRDAEQTRLALLRAARDLIAERGFDAASLDEISARAGFTRGAFHFHFRSKEELLLAVVEQHDRELLASYRGTAASRIRPDPVRTARRWHEIHADDSDVVLRLELRRLAMRSPELRDRLVQIESAAVDATAIRLSPAGSGPDRSRDMARLMHIVSRGLLEWTALSGEETESLMELFLSMVDRFAGD